MSAPDRPVRALVIGAGLRGRHVYGRWALDHPDALRVVGVAEPDPSRRRAFAAEHDLADTAVWDDWRAALAAPGRAEVAVVATGDTPARGAGLGPRPSCSPRAATTWTSCAGSPASPRVA